MTSPVNHDPMEALMVAPMRKTPSLMTDGGSDSGRQEWLRCKARWHEGIRLKW
ncbi:hypothetical protein F2Q69_00055336 [Brassica cretica]|nr:hypothetical protein F2Q69_00055336 [Brassica cretica]KAF3591670.1 hypothetical protein DY000_02024541 [Brassica cretica]